MCCPGLYKHRCRYLWWSGLGLKSWVSLLEHWIFIFFHSTVEFAILLLAVPLAVVIVAARIEVAICFLPRRRTEVLWTLYKRGEEAGCASRGCASSYALSGAKVF